MTKYAALMEQVRVTPDMRERILLALENTEVSEDPEPLSRKKPIPFRRWAAAAAALVVVAAAVWLVPRLIVPVVTSKGNAAPLASAAAAADEAAPEAVQEEEGAAMAGAPAEEVPETAEPAEYTDGVVFNAIETSSAEGLEELTGFPVSDLPYLKEQADSAVYLVIGDDLAEIEYLLPEGSACYRKSPGAEDNSGDYSEYEKVVTREIAGLSVTLKGDREGYYLALWEEDGYSYSLSFSDPVPPETFASALE